MNRNEYSIEKACGAWFAALIFSVVYLICEFSGKSTLTTLWRASVCALIGYFVGKLLLKTFIDVVLDALAEHKRRLEEEERKKREEEEARA